MRKVLIFFFLSTFFLVLHHFPPFAIACDGNDDVKAVERGFEGNFLVEIQAARDDIDHNPNEPLFEVFPRQRPNADKRKGRCERIGDGHARVGEGDEEIVNRRPRRQRYRRPKQGEAKRKMANRKFTPRFSLLVPRSSLPSSRPIPPTINRHREVVEFHSAVGVQPFFVIEHDTERLHRETDRPEPNRGAVFEDDVGQAENRREEVEPGEGHSL